MSEQKIAAVLVTYNRLDFLKKVVSSLKSQTKNINQIIVVNNGSTDGTSEWLDQQSELHVVNQENVGSSGGQYTGFKTAYENGYDWIWCMDDDVVPRNDCLEKLLYDDNERIVRTPLRYTPSGKPFLNDTIIFNLSNPFKNIWEKIISEVDLNNNIIYAEGITFEGPLFHRSVVEKIGLPEKKFFIFGDDSEYWIRADKAGFKSVIVTKAKADRLLEVPDLIKKFSWKNYYIIRNIIAIDILHANLPTRILRPFAYLFSWLRKANDSEERKTVIKAFKDGYFYKSDN